MWSRDNENLLQRAIEQKNWPRVTKLIAQSADLSARNSDGETFLHFALRTNTDDETLELLLPYYLEHSDLLCALDNDGQSVLSWCMLRNKKLAAKKILTAFKEKNHPSTDWLKGDKNNVTPLHWASLYADTALLSFIIDAIEDEATIAKHLAARDKNLDTPLHYALRANQRDNILKLLEHNDIAYLCNQKGLSFFTYLEEKPDFISFYELPPNVQRIVLQQHRFHMLANPENSAAQILHQEWANQTGLAAKIREQFWLERRGKVPSSPMMIAVMREGTDLAMERQFERLGDDKLKLRNLHEKLKKHKDAIDDDIYVENTFYNIYHTLRLTLRWCRGGEVREDDRRFQRVRRGRANIIDGISLIATSIALAPLIPVLAPGAAALLSLFLPVATAAFLPPIFFFGMLLALGVVLAMGISFIIYGIYQSSADNKLIQAHTEIISEAREIFDNLSRIQTDRLDQLPINMTDYCDLEDAIKYLENNDINDAIKIRKRLAKVASIIQKIKNGLIIPFTPDVAEELAAEPADKSISEPSPSHTVIEIPQREQEAGAEVIVINEQLEQQQIEPQQDDEELLNALVAQLPPVRNPQRFYAVREDREDVPDEGMPLMVKIEL